MMQRTLKIATLNVRRSAITKIAAIHEAAGDIDILAVSSAMAETRLPHGLWPPSPGSLRRVALLSKLARRPITIHLSPDADRWRISA